MKKFFIFASIVTIFFFGAGFFVGDYFVTFALKRGADGSPPKAARNISDPALRNSVPPNFPSELWEIKSAEGLKLCATKFSPQKKTHRWAILIHGYGRDQNIAFDYAEKYLAHGYNVLTPDLRASGLSDGIFLTMGTLESRDIVLWTEKISEVDPQAKIILHGVSMGAAIVMQTSALEPKNFAAGIEDCGYTTAYEIFSAQLEKIFHLPAFPTMNFVNIVSKFETGVALSDAAPILSVTKTKVPMLFIHGDEDKLIPIQMMEKLFDASAAPVKEKFIVAGAGHAVAKNKNPDEYFAKVFAFADRFAGSE